MGSPVRQVLDDGAASHHACAGWSAETSGREADGEDVLRASTPAPRVKRGPRGWHVAIGADGALEGCEGPPASAEASPLAVSRKVSCFGLNCEWIKFTSRWWKSFLFTSACDSVLSTGNNSSAGNQRSAFTKSAVIASPLQVLICHLPHGRLKRSCALARRCGRCCGRCWRRGTCCSSRRWSPCSSAAVRTSGRSRAQQVPACSGSAPCGRLTARSG